MLKSPMQAAVVVATVWTALCFLPDQAHGGQPPDHVTVMIASRKTKEESNRALAALRSQMAGLKVVLNVRWISALSRSFPAQIREARRLAKKKSVLAVFWCDFTDQDQILVYIARPGLRRVFVRRVDRSREGARGAFEAIGVIVRTTVEAIRQGGRIGVVLPRKARPIPTRPALRTPPRPPGARSRDRFGAVSLSLEAAYTATMQHSPKQPLHGGYLGLEMRFSRSWSVMVGSAFHPDITINDHQTTIQLGKHPILLGGRFRHAFGRFTLAGQLHLTLDIHQWHTTVHSDALEARPDGTDIGIGIGAQLRGEVRIHSWMRLFVAAGAEVLVRSPKYTIQLGDRRLGLLDPWPVQPCLLVGISFKIL